MNRFQFPWKQREKYLLFPGAVSWERWVLRGGEIVFVEQTTLETVANEPLWLLALPVQHVHALPLWINRVDQSLITDIVNVQLERHGLVPRQHEELVARHQIIAEDGDRQLVLVFVLPPHLPEKFQITQALNYEPSALFWSLIPNHITIWREEKRLVTAFNHNGKLCYFQALGQDDLNAEAIDELRCLKLQLQAQKIAPLVIGITLWGDFLSQTIDRLASALQVPAKISARPTPQLPANRCQLMPPLVQRAQHKINKRYQIQYASLVFLAVYLLFLVGWLGIMSWRHFQKMRLETALRKNAATVGRLLETATLWHHLQPAINPDYYPLELLNNCAAALPPEGVRLTLFELQNSKILMRGEAKSARAAFKFKGDLEATHELANRRWQMPQPQALPNDSVQFQIEGGDPHASAN